MNHYWRFLILKTFFLLLGQLQLQQFSLVHEETDLSAFPWLKVGKVTISPDHNVSLFAILGPVGEHQWKQTLQPIKSSGWEGPPACAIMHVVVRNYLCKQRSFCLHQSGRPFSYLPVWWALSSGLFRYVSLMLLICLPVDIDFLWSDLKTFSRNYARPHRFAARLAGRHHIWYSVSQVAFQDVAPEKIRKNESRRREELQAAASEVSRSCLRARRKLEVGELEMCPGKALKCLLLNRKKIRL